MSPLRFRILAGCLAYLASGAEDPAWGAPDPAAVIPAPPNVLFIAIDDLNDWVGCMGGHPQAKTPHLDRLAASGVLFTNAHCAAPACNPSRTAIFTGIAPHVSGVYANGQKMREVLPDAELLPKYFSRHGYWAGGSGKMLHYFIDARSWDEYFPPKETEDPFPPHIDWGKRPKSLPRGGPWQYAETDWHAFDVTDDEFGGDAKVADWVGAKLMGEHKKPFFLACGIYRPHEPWFVPKKYFDLFPLDEVQLPPGYKEDDLDDLPPAGKKMGPNRYFDHIRKHGQWRKAVQAYLASIAYADAMLGRVLEALQNSPHRDNTIVVLWSDHGWHLGEKQHWQKFTTWRASTRVPFIVRVPKGAPGLPQGTTAGGVCSRPVNLLSLFPTLTDLCGLPAKDGNDGPSVVPLLADPKAEWPHVSITYAHEPGTIGISAEGWRYIRYADGGEELYDTVEDPYEWTNLLARRSLGEGGAGNAGHAAKLESLRARAPEKFAPLVPPKERSLPKLAWRPGGPAPASKPVGNRFDVVFFNDRKTPVKLSWIDGDGKPKSYGEIAAGKRRRQQTRPGAVWRIDDEAGIVLGHVIVEDRPARVVIPEAGPEKKRPKKQGAARKPNVLFIAIDDLRPELGCYGVKSVHSPHIDRFAKSGVLFERAYCQLAVCNPSRVSLMTGLRPDSAKVWDLRTLFRETVPDTVTLPQQFMKHGYYAASFGKIFHNPWPDNASWSEPHAWPEAGLWSDEAKKRLAGYRATMRAEGKSEEAIERMRAPATGIVDVPDHEHIDGAIAEQALAALRRLAKGDDPFFIAAGFVRPHLPFVVPRKYWEMYQRDEIPLAENSFLPRDAPEFAMNTMYELRDYMDYADAPDPREGGLTSDQHRELKHGYYASVSFIDAQVGRLLAELDKLGLADDTIVVLWGDHGWKLGEHNSWCKQTNYEIDARVPLIIRAPGAKANGTTSRSLAELVDIYPTLCELAALPAAAHVEGTSLAPILDDPGAVVKEAAISQYRRQDGMRPLMGYAMRTDRYRYVEWIDRRTQKAVAFELYDHQADPDENTNVAAEHVHKKRLVQLSEQLWKTLPAPPPFREPKALAGGGRAKLQIRNNRKETLRVYWLPEEGERRKVGEVAPGETLFQNTTMGHRFLVEGTRSKLRKAVTITKAKQTINFNIGKPAKKPNIVFFLADDWSWPHAGACGDKTVKTPHFDRVAREGVHFTNAFVSTPSCTPSRASILTGQHHWRLKEADSLGGSLREEFPVYTDLLAEAGYRVGRYGKGVWPSKHKFRNRDSFGERFRSFDDFLATRREGEPICYFHGGKDPHRPYETGIGEKSGIDLDAIDVPPCLPDHPEVRRDLADYYWHVQRFDREVGAVLARLEAIGELENSIVVVSGDNGMPFPRSKATLYDLGTRVPLAIRWGARVKGNRTVDDFVSLCDLAPTFLQAAGLEAGEDMTGSSLLPILLSGQSGRVEPARTHVVTGMERHVYSYPSRAYRSSDHLYVRNFHPQKWPSGEIEGKNPEYDFTKTPWPTGEGAFSFNIDPSPSKQVLRLHRDDAEVKPIADRTFAKRPREEFYNLRDDPHQLRNLAGLKQNRRTLTDLRELLAAELIASQDPRIVTPGYETRTIEGWTLLIDERLFRQHQAATERAEELLEAQLKTIVERVPAQAVAHLRKVPLWFSPKYEGFDHRAEYHPEGSWLRENGRNPAMAKGVEFSCIPIFEAETIRMPMFVLHELSHAYHDQVQGFDFGPVVDAYQAAVTAKSYERVKRAPRTPGGAATMERAYAITDHKEYFAEATEAFFGKNDFFPFTRAELKKHDPDLFALVATMWGTGSADGSSAFE